MSGKFPANYALRKGVNGKLPPRAYRALYASDINYPALRIIEDAQSSTLYILTGYSIAIFTYNSLTDVWVDMGEMFPDGDFVPVDIIIRRPSVYPFLILCNSPSGSPVPAILRYADIVAGTQVPISVIRVFTSALFTVEYYAANFVLAESDVANEFIFVAVQTDDRSSNLGGVYRLNVGADNALTAFAQSDQKGFFAESVAFIKKGFIAASLQVSTNPAEQNSANLTVFTYDISTGVMSGVYNHIGGPASRYGQISNGRFNADLNNYTFYSFEYSSDFSEPLNSLQGLHQFYQPLSGYVEIDDSYLPTNTIIKSNVINAARVFADVLAGSPAKRFECLNTQTNVEIIIDNITLLQYSRFTLNWFNASTPSGRLQAEKRVISQYTNRDSFGDVNLSPMSGGRVVLVLPPSNPNTAMGRLVIVAAP